MLTKNAERVLCSLLREYVHLRGSNGMREAELRGQLRGFREALVLTKQLTEGRFQEMFAAAHLEVLGMTASVSASSLGVSVHQLDASDWDKFDTPTFVRRGHVDSVC